MTAHGRRLILTSALLTLSTSVHAQPPAADAGSAASCATQREADVAIAAGWEHWARRDVQGADSLFRAGVQLCPRSASGWTGLGYVTLNQGENAAAAARFETAIALGAARSADAWIGIGLATFRLGEPDRARRAFLTADSLSPGDATVRTHLERLPLPINASQLPTHTRAAERRVAARTGRRVLEVPDSVGSGWRPLWIKAVNIGAALPGKHPSEFPPDDGTYEEWLRLVAEMGANTVRVYTIHPPHFYRALDRWNLEHPKEPLWLIHGVWTELPPGKLESEYDDVRWNADFEAEMRRVVDLLHGNAAIPHRPGHAAGLYVTDVSRWTLGYIIGREWEPYSVVAFAGAHPERTAFNGTYVRVEGGNAVDVWLARVADAMIGYEMERYNTQRPLAYTNWPTLDPLVHPTESTLKEEAELLRRRGERLPEVSREYDNDAIGLDARRMIATAAFPAGLFASYHAYPYYPDFMLYDPRYRVAQGPEGPSNYFGYLRALVEHHGDMPVVISEYGVPSSRGQAHVQPQGWNHGGHDEQAQAEINARLTREIHAAGAAGAGLFAIIDEWFKKNWLVTDFEKPGERNRLWLNTLDPEQNYGVLAMRAGTRETGLRLDGVRDDWNERGAVYRGTAAQRAVVARPAPLQLNGLSAHADEAYLWLRLDVGAIDWTRGRYLVGIDTWDARRGDSRLPYTRTTSPTGLEFVLDLRGPGDSQLLVDRAYNLYRFPRILGSSPPDSLAVYNRPFKTEANSDGVYDTLIVTPNRRRIGRDGQLFPAIREVRNGLRHARQDESTLADWYADTTTGTIEIRIPWGMLHVLDPSSRAVLFGVDDGHMPAGEITEGFRFVVQSYDPRDPTAPLGELWPQPSARGAARALPPLWSWPTWEVPTWHVERKPLFDAMRETFRAIPDGGTPRP